MKIPLKRAKNVKNGGFSLDPPFLRELADFTLDFIGVGDIAAGGRAPPCIVMASRDLRALWVLKMGVMGERGTAPFGGLTAISPIFLDPPFLRELGDFSLDFSGHFVLGRMM